MSRRTKTAFMIAGTAAAAGAAGWAVGMLFAPTPGKHLRRRLAWRSEKQWKAFAHAGEKFVQEITARAAAEIERAKACGKTMVKT